MYALSAGTLDENQELADTWIGRILADQPAQVIDIGARDGVHPMFHRLGCLCAVLGFEPDAESYAALTAPNSQDHPFREMKFAPVALGAGNRQTFHTYSAPTNNSLLPPNLTLTQRYEMNMFEQRGSFELETHCLDDVLFGNDESLTGYGELLKLDTQGTEKVILENARRMLRQNTAGLVAEVWFCEIYKGQDLFHHLCTFLEEHGFKFYGFLDFFLRSRKRLDKREYIGRERALYADAVFMRDPLDLPKSARGDADADRNIALLFVFALITGYFDFALELAETFGGNDRETLLDIAKSEAKADRSAAARDFDQAHQAANENRADAMLAMGRFADKWRDRLRLHRCPH